MKTESMMMHCISICILPGSSRQILTFVAVGTDFDYTLLWTVLFGINNSLYLSLLQITRVIQLIMMHLITSV